jgi:hypothetical protein
MHYFSLIACFYYVQVDGLFMDVSISLRLPFTRNATAKPLST